MVDFFAGGGIGRDMGPLGLPLLGGVRILDAFDGASVLDADSILFSKLPSGELQYEGTNSARCVVLAMLSAAYVAGANPYVVLNIMKGNGGGPLASIYRGDIFHLIPALAQQIAIAKMISLNPLDTLDFRLEASDGLPITTQAYSFWLGAYKSVGRYRQAFGSIGAFDGGGFDFQPFPLTIPEQWADLDEPILEADEMANFQLVAPASFEYTGISSVYAILRGYADLACNPLPISPFDRNTKLSIVHNGALVGTPQFAQPQVIVEQKSMLAAVIRQLQPGDTISLANIHDDPLQLFTVSNFGISAKRC